MGEKLRTRLKRLSVLALLLPGMAASQSYRPPIHSDAPSPLIAGAANEAELKQRADAGMQVERNRSPAEELAELRRLERALAALGPQRRGTVDAYLVAIALDSDPVFGREARAVADVLQRRYGAAGRTIVLAGTDGSAPSALPRGTPASLGIVLARIAELMDKSEDALILYTTSHGTPFGLYYNDADSGFGAISPARLRAMLDGLGIRNRLLLISACYSGVFVPELRTPTTAIVTAAASDRTSFGCAADNDWTFFGDAMVNRAMRKPQPLMAAFAEMQGLVAAWEVRVRTTPSDPQIDIGNQTARWLGALEQRMPQTATAPVGRPAIETTPVAAGRSR